MNERMPDTDRELVERARLGERDAFEVLVRRHLPGAYATAIAVLHEPADAEDVTQDAFVVALERLDECRQPDRFAAWLMRIVRNRAHNYRRAAKVRAASPLSVAEGQTSPSGDSADRAQLRVRLTRALEMLNDTHREVVLLHDLEGWRHREIAEALELPEGTVRSHLFHARRALRRELGMEPEEA
ncbi:MAG: RNA polymerase sigma factor [Longimicrobiales bacterium]